ncbi:MAG: TIGR02301 family protein [Hyphomicrobium sp.]|nr:TIGR02301 family protein [Hyphomicrobium sp.]
MTGPQTRTQTSPRAAANRPHNRTSWARAAACTIALAGAVLSALPAAHAAPDVKPYDDKLLRLAEILGAVHYLRELCGANEGQYWRDRMRELTDAEGYSALRRAKLSRAFNQGYRSYSRTYNTCSPSAQTVITRFLAEGTQLSEGLVKGSP